MISFVSSFNWLPRSSAWLETQTWHARQQEHQAKFEAVHNGASEIFSTAMVNFTIGMGDITAKVATARTKAAMRLKVQALLDKKV